MVSVLLITALPNDSHAYLLPLIGGLGWAIAIVFGLVAFLGSYIWINVKRIKGKLSKTSVEKNEEDSGKNS